MEEEVEEMEEIELSSDEEGDDSDDVALIVLKRPPVTERTVEEVEVRELGSKHIFLLFYYFISIFIEHLTIY